MKHIIWEPTKDQADALLTAALAFGKVGETLAKALEPVSLALIEACRQAYAAREEGES